MSRDVLLVGSVPLADSAAVFRAAGEALGANLTRVPDGETGTARSLWFQCQIPALMVQPQLETVEPDPDNEGSWRTFHVPSWGIYNPALAKFFRGKFRVRAGVDRNALVLDGLGYAEWAIESYRVFAKLKEAGTLAADTRLQVCIPAPSVMAYMGHPDDLDVLLPAYQLGLFAEIEKLCAIVPHAELAIQWDSTDPRSYELGGAEQREQIARMLTSLAAAVPEGVELGYHLCYGDIEHKHMVDPKDLGAVVELSNRLTGRVERQIDWIHVPVPRDRDDAEYFAPLADLDLSPGTQLYVGLIHLTDGVDGTLRRMKSASAVYDGYGIATECGFGRRDPADVHELLRIHADLAELGPRQRVIG